MTLSEAAESRRLWIAKGNPHCSHLKVDDEVFDPVEGIEGDAKTGEFVCVACGKVFHERPPLSAHAGQ